MNKPIFLSIIDIRFNNDKTQIEIFFRREKEYKFVLKVYKHGVSMPTELENLLYGVKKFRDVIKLIQEFCNGKQLDLPANFEYIEYPSFDPNQGFDQFENSETKVPAKAA